MRAVIQISRSKDSMTSNSLIQLPRRINLGFPCVIKVQSQQWNLLLRTVQLMVNSLSSFMRGQVRSSTITYLTLNMPTGIGSKGHWSSTLILKWSVKGYGSICTVGTLQMWLFVESLWKTRNQSKIMLTVRSVKTILTNKHPNCLMVEVCPRWWWFQFLVSARTWLIIVIESS